MKNPFRRKPKPNAWLGHETFHFDFAQSIDDIVVICGPCSQAMVVEGEELVCPGCGNHENGDEMFEVISIVGPGKGYRPICWPEGTEVPA